MLVNTLANALHFNVELENTCCVNINENSSEEDNGMWFACLSPYEKTLVCSKNEEKATCLDQRTWTKAYWDILIFLY